MPRVISSLDAHMENGLQRLYSCSLSFAKPSLACSFYAMPKATLVQWGIYLINSFDVSSNSFVVNIPLGNISLYNYGIKEFIFLLGVTKI